MDHIIAGLALLTLQTGLIIGLLVLRARRRRAESELRASFVRIRELGGRLLTAQETERTRIARELHDDITQHLAVLKLDLHLLAETVQGPAETAASEAMKYADDIATERPESLAPVVPRKAAGDRAGHVLSKDSSANSLTTVPALRSHTKTFRRACRPIWPCASSESCRKPCRMPSSTVRPKTISVHLTGNSHRLDLTVVDDGVGFVVEGAGHQGFGLISMGERVEAMGGTFNVSSSPHRGTRLNVTMPVPTTENSGASRSEHLTHVSFTSADRHMPL